LETLGDRQLVSVVVRMVFDRAERLIYLEIVEVNDRLSRRITRWEDVMSNLQALAETALRRRRRGGQSGEASTTP
jgi:hypothetical protein